MCIAALLCLALSHGTACSGRSGLGVSGPIKAGADSRLDIDMTEQQVIEVMKNNGEIVAIIPGNAHTYRVKGANFRKIMDLGEQTVDGSVEFLVTVNFRNGRVSSISTSRY